MYNPDADIQRIHTSGLRESFRCMLCTNPTKNDTGCDGDCIVNDFALKKIMQVIDEHIIKD